MRLRPLLFLSFALVSLIPVGLLAYWEQQRALERELASVHEKHLLLAQNLTGTLDLYTHDLGRALAIGSDMFSMHHSTGQMDRLFNELNFNYVCLVDGSGHPKASDCEYVADDHAERPLDVFNNLVPLRDAAIRSPGIVKMSGIVPSMGGQPTLYAMKATADDSLIFGSIRPDFIVQEQQKIAFGEKGHAAIVDRNGKVMAHPLPAWVADMKDISKLDVVQRMMRGETGVTQFYSPALKADMVAGYTAVPSSGWGVMVPQPYSELVAQARSLQTIVFGISAMGIVIALLLSWWLSGSLATPLSEIARASKAFADGGRATKLPRSDGLVPSEVRDLSRSFEQMVTDIEKKNNDLQTVTDRAVSASEAKSKFLSSISHELRTPMNAVLGFSQILMRRSKDELSAQSQESLHRLNGSAEHLMELIDELLDLNSIEEGHVQLTIVDTSIEDVVGASINHLKARAKDAGISIHYDPTKMPGTYVRADRKRLMQVFLNLLSNAVKYNKPGGQISIECQEMADDMVRVSVTDTGLGIPAGIQAKAFTPFERLGRETGEIDGTGIGLTITKQLVELMGGNMGFSSTEHVGSEFWFDLPRGVPTSIHPDATGSTKAGLPQVKIA